LSRSFSTATTSVSGSTCWRAFVALLDDRRDEAVDADAVAAHDHRLLRSAGAINSFLLKVGVVVRGANCARLCDLSRRAHVISHRARIGTA